MKPSVRECLALVYLNALYAELPDPADVKLYLTMQVEDTFRFEKLKVEGCNQQEVLQEISSASPERLLGFLEGLDGERRAFGGNRSLIQDGTPEEELRAEVNLK
jgi:hypothetical protein